MIGDFKELVIASNNPGKLREIRQLLEPLGLSVHSQSEFDIREADEPHSTFVENALAKARHAARLSGLPALADDSGICVDALSGAPGVQSARLAGEPRSDERNNRKLLELISGVSDRRAHYYCVIVLVRHALDPEPILCQAEWHGELLRGPRGSGGFGYDPLFLIPELGQTGAELPLELKNQISHRGKALAQLVVKLRERGGERRSDG
jgi:XTP/dITP diphosphohydrolase